MADTPILVAGTVWVDRLPAVSGRHRDLHRRLVKVNLVGDQWVHGQSYWEFRGTDPRDREWHRDRTSKSRPTVMRRSTFERKFEFLEGGRSAEQMLREQVARDILDYDQAHDHGAMYAGDAFNIAAHIARGEDPHCTCMDNSYVEEVTG